MDNISESFNINKDASFSDEERHFHI